jgi:hypothetical protein
VAEGAIVPLPGAIDNAAVAASTISAAACVSVVLGDALRRVAVLGGREGMSRSLGSVPACTADV